MHLSTRSFLNKQQIVLHVSPFLHSRAHNESADMFHQNLSVSEPDSSLRPRGRSDSNLTPSPRFLTVLFALSVQDSLLQAQLKHCSVSLNLTKAQLLPGPDSHRSLPVWFFQRNAERPSAELLFKSSTYSVTCKICEL